MNIGLVYRSRPRWPKVDWVSRALVALGHVRRQVETMEQLEQADAECDVILFEHREPGPGRKNIVQFSPKRKAIWATWWMDLFLGMKHQPLVDLYGDLNRCMDVVFVKERGRIEEYRSKGVHAEYMDQGCPSHLGRCEHRENPEFDVLLFGSALSWWEQRRRDVQALVDAGFRVAWASDKGEMPKGVTAIQWTHYEDLPKLMSRAAMTLHVDITHEEAGYWSDRQWLAMGAGSLLIKRHTPGQYGEGHLTYFDTDQLCQLVGYWLGKGRSARAIRGSAARDMVLAHHTYEKRVERVLESCKHVRHRAGTGATAC